MKKMIRTNLTLAPDTISKLTEIKDSIGAPMSASIRIAVDDYYRKFLNSISSKSKKERKMLKR